VRLANSTTRTGELTRQAAIRRDVRRAREHVIVVRSRAAERKRHSDALGRPTAIRSHSSQHRVGFQLNVTVC